MSRPRFRSRKSRWGLLVAGCCVGLLMCEAIAALAFMYRARSKPPTWLNTTYFPVFDDPNSPAGLYRAHPYSGYDLKPNFEEVTNNLGFRGPDVTLEKPGGTIRIVCIGGSTTYCVRNDWQFSYPKLLGDELTSTVGPHIEVINAGLVGATSVESAHRLIGKVLPLDPDLVIIYHGINDLGPRVLDHPEIDNSGFRRVPLNRYHGLNRILNRSHSARLIKTLLPPGNLHRYTLSRASLPDDESERIENFHRHGTASFERHMELMIRLLRSFAIEPVVPTFAIHGEHHDSWLEFLPKELWEPGIEQNNRAIRRLVDEHGLVPVPFYEHALGQESWFNGQVHMTNLGNLEKARFIAEQIAPIVREVSIAD